MFLYCAFTKILASEEFTSATSVVREKFCSDKESKFGSYSACLEQMKLLNEKIYEQLCLKFESMDSNYREAIEEISSRHHFRNKE